MTCYRKILETMGDCILPKFESGFIDTQRSYNLHKHSKLLDNIQDTPFLEEYIFMYIYI